MMATMVARSASIQIIVSVILSWRVKPPKRHYTLFSPYIIFIGFDLIPSFIAMSSTVFATKKCGYGIGKYYIYPIAFNAAGGNGQG